MHKFMLPLSKSGIFLPEDFPILKKPDIPVMFWFNDAYTSARLRVYISTGCNICYNRREIGGIAI
jgi:hypothetical protein